MFIRFSAAKHDSRNLLLGIILAFAILDHARMFFYYWNLDPTAIEQTSIAVFLTRFLSHFFAPSIFFLLGIEMFLYRERYGIPKLNLALCYSGIMLLLLEVFVNNFAYTFDLHYRTIGLFILGMLGLCFFCMIGLHYLKRKVILLVSLIIVLGHNVLDSIQLEGHSLPSIFWYLLHQQKFILADHRLFIVNYTVIPWLAVLMLGYSLGVLYQPDADPMKRRKTFLFMGWSSAGLFLLTRFFNHYGDPSLWHVYPDPTRTLMSFLNVTKYPASLSYLALTLSVLFLFLAYTSAVKMRDGFLFGTLAKNPLFVYVFSTCLIHVGAFVLLWMNGRDPMAMVITSSSYSATSPLIDYGYAIETVYLIWIGILILMYGFCLLINRLLGK